MTARPDPAYLEQLTAVAEMWRRRCNEQPAGGILVHRSRLLPVLAASVDVQLDRQGRITWRAPGNGRSMFSAEPEPAEPLTAPA